MRWRKLPHEASVLVLPEGVTGRRCEGCLIDFPRDAGGHSTGYEGHEAWYCSPPCLERRTGDTRWTELLARKSPLEGTP